MATDAHDGGTVVLARVPIRSNRSSATACQTGGDSAMCRRPRRAQRTPVRLRGSRGVRYDGRCGPARWDGARRSLLDLVGLWQDLLGAHVDLLHRSQEIDAVPGAIDAVYLSRSRLPLSVEKSRQPRADPGFHGSSGGSVGGGLIETPACLRGAAVRTCLRRLRGTVPDDSMGMKRMNH
jgi:hypothetical protein